LKENLENHNSIYSLCLGLSELLANFEYIDEISLQRTNSGDWINLDSVIPVSSILDKNSIDFELTREIFKVNYPILMLPDRVVDKREDILFERNGESIKCKLEEYWKLENGENIVFF
jgi:CRISPR-associated protein Cas5h